MFADNQRTTWVHVAAIFLFGVLTTVWLWPLLRAPAAAIPGTGPGDNFIFVWNLWWAKRSLLAGTSPLWCPLLFVPFGVDLTLHTHTLLPSAIAGALVRDVLVGTNAIICAHLFLNFAAGYALAWRLTRDWPAAIVGAILVGWSPYVGERLLGHFNLIAVWVFPLTALLTLDTLQGSRRGGVLLGICLAGIAWLEYYYAVYAAALVLVFFAAHVVDADWRSAPAWSRRAVRAIAVPIAISLLIGVFVLITGGTVWRVAGLMISLRSAGNPLAAAWLLTLAAGATIIASRLRLRVTDRAGPCLVRLTPAIIVATICTLPLLISVTRVWLHGDYVSQRYLWRSAPKGIDLGTLVMGHPRGAVWNEQPLRAYVALGIDEIEQTAWFPPAALCLGAIAILLRRREKTVRLLLWTGAAFVVWALGPYVVAFGRTLPLPLPAILLRYVPIVANARVPGRTVVLVYLAIAMLAAIGVSALRQRQRGAWAAVLAAAALVDSAPARPPLYRVERPAIYETLRQRPEAGAVCELPFGLRDSFGETGRFDPLLLWHQVLHERGIAGGFISRLPPRISTAYASSPVFGALLRLSAGGDPESPVSRDAAVEELQHAGIRFIVVDRSLSSPALVRFVDQLGLTRVAADQQRDALLVSR